MPFPQFFSKQKSFATREVKITSAQWFTDKNKKKDVKEKNEKYIRIINLYSYLLFIPLF